MKYRSFINPDFAIGVYRSIREKTLDLVENGSKLPHEELERALLSLNDELDKLFAILKESEKRIILSGERITCTYCKSDRTVENEPA